MRKTAILRVLGMLCLLLVLGSVSCATKTPSGEGVTLANAREAADRQNRGVTLTNEGRYDEAIAELTKAIELNPRLQAAYYNRGSVYLERAKKVYIERAKKGEYDKAIADFDNAIADFSKAIELNPSDVDSYSQRGGTYTAKGEYELAAADFNKIIEISKDPAAIERARKFLGQLEQVKESFGVK